MSKDGALSLNAIALKTGLIRDRDRVAGRSTALLQADRQAHMRAILIYGIPLGFW